MTYSCLLSEKSKIWHLNRSPLQLNLLFNKQMRFSVVKAHVCTLDKCIQHIRVPPMLVQAPFSHCQSLVASFQSTLFHCGLNPCYCLMPGQCNENGSLNIELCKTYLRGRLRKGCLVTLSLILRATQKAVKKLKLLVGVCRDDKVPRNSCCSCWKWKQLLGSEAHYFVIEQYLCWTGWWSHSTPIFPPHPPAKCRDH